MLPVVARDGPYNPALSPPLVHLLSNLKLARHTVYNLVGLGAPLLLALLSIPALVAGLGAERFGLLTLVWAITSYFGLFDLGLGRALTQQLAVVLSRDQHDRIGPLCATALILMAVLGLAGGLLLALGAPLGAELLRELPSRQEAVVATWAMAVAMPFIVLTAGLRGMLEACHAFAALNAIRLPMGLWTFAGPWLVLYWHGPDLPLIALALAAGRVLACAVHAWLAWRALPQLQGRLRFDKSLLRPLCTSGGWLSLSNVVSPFMGYVDRFMIGAALSAAAVAYYVTPQELVTKLWIVPGALTAVLFPAFAARVAAADASAWRLFDRALRLLFWALLPVTAGLCLFAHELLGWWIGPAFAVQSGGLLQIFALGIFINCLAHVPLTWLHGAGRYRAPALLHCIELPFFMAVLWLLVQRFGLMGAAWAWLLRIGLDAAGLFALCLRERPGRAALFSARGLSLLGLVCASFAGAWLPQMWSRAAWLTALLLLATTMAWRMRHESA